MIATESGGLLDKSGQIVNKVEEIDNAIMDLVDTSKSSLGLGGMSSKLTFAKLATKMGIKVTIFGIKSDQAGILKSFNHEAGTTFAAKEVNLSARNKWLISGGLTAAQIRLDDGAVTAIKQRKSLLSVGVLDIIGSFDKGEVVELVDSNGVVIAVARSREASSDIKEKQLVAHADDIVII